MAGLQRVFPPLLNRHSALSALERVVTDAAKLDAYDLERQEQQRLLAERGEQLRAAEGQVRRLEEELAAVTGEAAALSATVEQQRAELGVLSKTKTAAEQVAQLRERVRELEQQRQGLLEDTAVEQQAWAAKVALLEQQLQETAAELVAAHRQREVDVTEAHRAGTEALDRAHLAQARSLADAVRTGAQELDHARREHEKALADTKLEWARQVNSLEREMRAAAEAHELRVAELTRTLTAAKARAVLDLVRLGSAQLCAAEKCCRSTADGMAAMVSKVMFAAKLQAAQKQLDERLNEIMVYKWYETVCVREGVDVDVTVVRCKPTAGPGSQ